MPELGDGGVRVVGVRLLKCAGFLARTDDLRERGDLSEVVAEVGIVGEDLFDFVPLRVIVGYRNMAIVTDLEPNLRTGINARVAKCLAETSVESVFTLVTVGADILDVDAAVRPSRNARKQTANQVGRFR